MGLRSVAALGGKGHIERNQGALCLRATLLSRGGVSIQALARALNETLEKVIR